MSPRRTLHPYARSSTAAALAENIDGWSRDLRLDELLILGSAAVRWDVDDGPPTRTTGIIDATSATPSIKAVMAELHPDPERAAALAAEVEASSETLPVSLRKLGTLKVGKVYEIIGDWLLDKFAIELLPVDAEAMTLVVRIDHRLGTIVTDAELMDTDPVALLRATTVVSETHPPMVRSVSSAKVRAYVEQALTTPRPPLGVDATTGWEPLRPLLTWVIARMPAGGDGYDDETLAHYRLSVRNETELVPDDERRPPTRRRYHDRTDPDGCESLELSTGLGMKSRTFGSQLLHEVTELVGGHEALAALDDAPLPDEPFDPTGVPDDILPAVMQVLDLCDRACDQLFDVEIRTATRRLLHRVATAGAASFRRKSSTHTAAAALVWTVATRNHRLGRHAVQAKDLAQTLAVSGSQTTRSAGLMRAVGLDPAANAPQFHADYLTSDRRARLITVRDSLQRQPVHRLRITLDGIEPPIERTIDVLGQQTFGHLHDVLQVAFGWDDCRDAQFELDGRLVARTDDNRDPWSTWGGPSRRHSPGRWDDDEDDDEDDGEPAMGEMIGLVLMPVLEASGTLRYRYDPDGADWVHTITVESRTTLGETSAIVPRLVSAKRATPPEDLSGVADYRLVLDSIGTFVEPDAQELCRRVRLPVRPGTFDPFRPDAEQARPAAISTALRDLTT